MCAVYVRYFWQGNHQIYGHILCIYTILANSMYVLDLDFRLKLVLRPGKAAAAPKSREDLREAVDSRPKEEEREVAGFPTPAELGGTTSGKRDSPACRSGCVRGEATTALKRDAQQALSDDVREKHTRQQGVYGFKKARRSSDSSSGLGALDQVACQAGRAHAAQTMHASVACLLQRHEGYNDADVWELCACARQV